MLFRSINSFANLRSNFVSISKALSSGISTIFTLPDIKLFFFSIYSGRAAYPTVVRSKVVGSSCLVLKIFFFCPVRNISQFFNLKLSNENKEILKFWENDFNKSIEQHIDFLNKNLENQEVYNAKFSEILQSMDIFENDDTTEKIGRAHV